MPLSGPNHPRWKGGAEVKRVNNALRAAEYRRMNPDVVRCHDAVNNAVRHGRLVRGPCEVCGEKKVDAHHDDYTKPLDVRWLCRKHHLELHRPKSPDSLDTQHSLNELVAFA